MSMLIALDNGFQACLMAPTEILSIQHYNGCLVYREEAAEEEDSVNGGSNSAQRKKINEKLEAGEIDI